jgi:hypothetical protein
VIDMAGGADDGMGDGVASDGGGHGAKQKLTPRATATKRAKHPPGIASKIAPVKEPRTATRG